MKKQENILDNLDNAPSPKKTSFIKILLIAGIIGLILALLEAMRFVYQFKDTTEL